MIVPSLCHGLYDLMSCVCVLFVANDVLRPDTAVFLLTCFVCSNYSVCLGNF